jgi:hypothetical protein
MHRHDLTTQLADVFDFHRIALYRISRRNRRAVA